MTSTAILIPVRYDSTRFPGKPLADLNGIPMIRRVYDTCIESGLDTYILTDDERIGTLFDPDCVIYSDQDFANGTERCAYASGILPYDTFLNVQGDMPDVTTEMIERVKNIIPQSGVSTAWTEMKKNLQSDPNSVKLVHNNVYAHWFGRGITYGSHHLGIYGYSRAALARYPLYNVSQHEDIEKLEQLRWINNNWKIAVTRVDFDGIEINTPEDMENWNESR